MVCHRRAATVTSLSECSLILIHAADYKGLTISDRVCKLFFKLVFKRTHSTCITIAIVTISFINTIV